MKRVILLALALVMVGCFPSYSYKDVATIASIRSASGGGFAAPAVTVVVLSNGDEVILKNWSALNAASGLMVRQEYWGDHLTRLLLAGDER